MSSIRQLLCDLCVTLLFGLCMVLAEDKPKSVDAITEVKGNCTCGGFPTSTPAAGAQPLLSQMPGLTIVCDVEGATTCKNLCEALATATKAKGPECLCNKLKDADELKLSAFYKVCDQAWAYAGMTADEALCCKDGKVKTCASAPAKIATPGDEKKVDAVSTERAVELAANTKGICYIRTSRPNTPILYAGNEVFKVGQAKLVRQSGKDKALVVGAGVTLHESVTAADQLKTEGVDVRILDPFTIKPLDEEALRAHARAAGGKVVVVEDHYQAGGLGEAVLSALALERDVIVKHIYVKEVPRSGPPQDLLDKYGLSAPHIAAAIKAIIKA